MRVIDAISVWSGKAFAWLILPMVGALVYEVAARYIFEAPTLWAFEATYMLYGTHFMVGAAYALRRQAHIRTDFVYRLLSARWQGAIDATLYLLFFFPGIALFFWVSWYYFQVSWAQSERSVLSPWQPPLYPFKAVVPLSAVLLFLQGISEFVKSVYAVRRGQWP